MAESGEGAERMAHETIVAVGASAGGITALRKLFGALPAEVPFALVVLQHLPAGQPSALARLVAKWTSIPVISADDGVRPQPNRVYVPSSDVVLTLEDRTFRTRPVEGGGRRPGIDTIDAFLESLASYSHADIDTGPPARAIAVILSGTGMDGTAGAVCIRQAGGVVIVQDPLTASHSSMPSAVIQRNIHDHVLPVGAIARQLLACADSHYARPGPTDHSSDVISEPLGRIMELIKRRAGFDLSGYKPSPLLWRIQQRMDSRKVWSFDDYAFLIEDDPAELEALVRGIPIHVTGFFRDTDAWDVLHHDVLAPLVLAENGDRPIRVWTPACSTGEEAYSVAMMLDEIANQHDVRADFQIFGTDAAPDLVAKASRGLFRDDSLMPVSGARRAHYFYAVDGGFRFKRPLRDKLVFVTQDLIADPPLSGFDLITCRNLLIYLQPETIDKVLRVLHGALREGGYLFLGKSEPYRLPREAFEAVSRQWNIYCKVGPLARAKQRASAAAPITPITTVAPVARHAYDGETRATNALRVALGEFDVPSVLLDEECTILRVFGNTDDILRIPAGEPTLKLIELVPKQWAAALDNSLRRALDDHEPLTLTHLRDRVSGELSMTVRITLLRQPFGDAWDRILVSFFQNDGFHAIAAPSNPPRAHDDASVPRGIDWKDEARVSRGELEASREELLALNEELKASNEQLNESNADLNDANAHLQENVTQMAMQSRVLQSGAVMTMFLDRDLTLRWFTPSMQSMFSLRPGDVGRCITDFAPKFRDAQFLLDIEDVLRTSEARESLVSGGEGRCLLRKIFPYMSDSNAITGVAITFADFTDRIHADRALRRNQAWLTAQKEAFQSAMNGGSLKSSLGILIRTLVSQSDHDRQCAFYIAEGDVLRHVVGMSESYARCVDGFVISPESLACGLAVATGEPVLTRDILDEPRWQPWTWLAQQFNYRGCWSFPVETSEGSLVGSLAMYFEEPREPEEVDLELASAFTQTAGIIIWRHLQTQQAGWEG